MSNVVAGGPARELVRTNNRRGRAGAVRPGAALHSPKWLLGFVLFEFICQLALLLPSIMPIRSDVRVAAFGASLVLLVLLRGAGPKHPAWVLAILVILILCASLANPDTNGLLPGAATILLALAILGPLFWVPTIRIGPETIRRLLLMLWMFNTASAIFGALQVYFPGRFQPAPSNILTEQAFQSLHITLASGARVPRPMGLTDVPGGAGIGAVYTVILASALLLARPRALFRIVLIMSIVTACFTLYLTQIRALVVMLMISMSGMVAVSATKRRADKTVFNVLIVLAAAVIGLGLAISIGGATVTDRLQSLIASDPQTTYYSHRGVLLEHTLVDLLPLYPLGAGLGRWGMIYSYFGTNSGPPIWAEIQWTGWLLDGGVPLMIAYAFAIVVALITTVRIARRAVTEDSDRLGWAGSLVGYSIGTIALTFSTAPFVGTGGMDFWLLNATLFAVSSQMATAVSGSGDGPW
jgi:hypothetical protein